MSRHPELYRWSEQLASRFPGLPPVFVTLLALWSLGMILAHRCGLSSVACYLARLLDQKDNTVRQRLREFYQEKEAKAGAKHGCPRTDFEASACFAPLLAWVLSFWSCPRLALALDVTNLGDRFHVLCVSVLYGGIGLPVAWKILPANQKEAWHPLMRVKAGGKFRPAGWVGWYRFGSLVPQVGRRFAAAGLAYKTAAEPLACTLLACWEAGHDEPWLLLTDWAVGSASPCWYAFRAWIEQGFKVVKSGALHWQRTRMEKAGRAERLWLAIAVSVLWLVVIGAAVEGDQRRETLGQVRERGPEAASRRAATVRRRQGLFRLGLAEWLAALVRGRPLPQGKLAPEPWPEVWHDVPTLTEQQFSSS